MRAQEDMNKGACMAASGEDASIMITTMTKLLHLPFFQPSINSKVLMFVERSLRWRRCSIEDE